MLIGKGTLVVSKCAKGDILPTLIGLCDRTWALTITCHRTNPVVILYLVLCSLCVALHQFVGACSRERQAFHQLRHVVGGLHAATEGGEAVFFLTTLGESAYGVTVATEGIVWIAVFVHDCPEPRVVPASAHISGRRVHITLLERDVGLELHLLGGLIVGIQTGTPLFLSVLGNLQLRLCFFVT